MSADWIEGRFEGIYSGARLQGESGSGSARRGKRPGKKRITRGDARRFTFRIDSGCLTKTAAAESPANTEGHSDLIHQDRVTNIQIVEPNTEASPTDRRLSLFDVEIRDWELKHPAEVDGQSFGTIVGTLRARLRPPPPRAVQKEVTPRQRAQSAVQVPVEAPRGDTPKSSAPVDFDSPAETVTRIGWSFLLVGLAALFVLFWTVCGSQVAVIWLAPVAIALLLRRRFGGRFASRAPWWTFPVLIGFQVNVLLLPSILGGMGSTGICAVASDPLRLGLMAAPVVIAGVLGFRGPMWLTGMIWTGVLCFGCMAGGTDGACSPAFPPLVQEKPIVPSQDTDGAARTDASGRWPVMPPVIGPSPGASPSPAPGFPASSGSASDLQLLGGGGTGRSDGNGGTSGSGAAGQESAAANDSSAAVVPDSSPAQPAPPSASRREGGSAAVQGGWVSPDHRRAERELVLISVEQANRTPALFFGSGGAHRVYIPTDPIFREASASLRPKAQLVLGRVAALLAAAPEQRVILDVHTDSAGSPEAQLGLANERARAIQSWLLNRGHIPPARFKTEALGGGRPLVPPDGDHGAQTPNRRIEIRLAPPE